MYGCMKTACMFRENQLCVKNWHVVMMDKFLGSVSKCVQWAPYIISIRMLDSLSQARTKKSDIFHCLFNLPCFLKNA